MRHSRGFTLVELMTAMAVYGIFLAMLSGAFYALLTFGSRSQKVLVAREHGRRVIEYVDSRIRNAGLGLHALKSSEAVRNALKPLTSNNPGMPFYNSKALNLPVAIAYYDHDDITDNVAQKAKKSKKPDDENIFIGNILTLLYAERESNPNINLVIYPVSKDNNKIAVQSDDVTTIGTIFKFLKFDKPSQYELSKLEYKKSNEDENKNNINNWVVLRGSGVPFYTEPHRFGTYDIYGVKLKTAKGTEKVYAGDELLYLRCESIFAENPRDNDKKVGEAVRNLKVQKLEGTSWGSVNPTETGILEIYAELNTRTNIFTLWVLSTGGKDSIVHERPSDWPVTARPTDWNSKNNFYKYETLYVSKASWKLNNIYEHFNWDN